MTAATPRTVEQYLDALRAALKGADPALVQDALYDAEEHLRAELAQHPGEAEGDVLARIVTSYGAPDEVADAYRANEATIQKALRTPPPRPRTHRARPLLRRLRRPARLPVACCTCCSRWSPGIVYFTFAAIGPVAVGRPRDPDHRRAVLPAVHRRGARDRAGRGPHRRDAARHAHAAAPAVSRTARRRSCRRIGDMLKDPRTWGTLLYLAADAAARRLLFHVRGGRHLVLARDDPSRRSSCCSTMPASCRSTAIVECAAPGAAAAGLDPRDAAAHASRCTSREESVTCMANWRRRCSSQHAPRLNPAAPRRACAARARPARRRLRPRRRSRAAPPGDRRAGTVGRDRGAASALNAAAGTLHPGRRRLPARRDCRARSTPRSTGAPTPRIAAAACARRATACACSTRARRPAIGPLLVVFGIAPLKPGESARNVPVNLTLVREGTGQFFATQGDDKCAFDSVTPDARRRATQASTVSRAAATARSRRARWAATARCCCRASTWWPS